MINFKAVSKKFGKNLVLDEIDFTIQPKEFVFLVGRSGCGKTTVFKLLTREYESTSGTIEYKEKNIRQIANGKLWEYRRKIGVIFQDMKLLGDRTVFENISLALELRGEATGEIKKKVDEIVNLVNLKGKENLFPKELSGGEIQRVTIARAVVGNPEVILADEPTADLDQATGWEIIQILKMINDAGKTVVIATHNFDIVNSMKKRVILLDQGKITKDGLGEKVKI
jgi:cell division transport system ATP-binding protein